jgi:signal transduction histidine kinase
VSANIACRFKIPVALPSTILDGQVRHDVFLAVKETLHNVVRHSRATEVEFHLEVVENGIRIVIVDNGQGFDPDAADGHGLKNIPERLARMGGHCRVESQPGTGTRVTIHIPIAGHGPAPVDTGTRS